MNTLTRAILVISLILFSSSQVVCAMVKIPSVWILASDSNAREPYECSDENTNTSYNINNGEFTVYRSNTNGSITVGFRFSGTSQVCQGCLSGPGQAVICDYFYDGSSCQNCSGHSGEVVFHPGESRQTIRIVPYADGLCEPTETVICSLYIIGFQNYTYAIGSPSSAIVYITDSPTSIIVNALQPTAVEGMSTTCGELVTQNSITTFIPDPNSIVFQISKDCFPEIATNIPPLPPETNSCGGNAEAIGYILSGTAIPGVDYPLPPGATILPDGTAHGFAYFNGGQNAYVSICPFADCIDENDETVVLSINLGGLVLSHYATGTIINRPCPVALSNEQLSEGIFSFDITGDVGSSWEVYRSEGWAWEYVSTICLTGGSATFTDNSIGNLMNYEDVTAGYYYIKNGDVSSDVIGFNMVTVPGDGYSMNWITNPFASSNPSLDNILPISGFSGADQSLLLNGGLFIDSSDPAIWDYGDMVNFGSGWYYWIGGNSYNPAEAAMFGSDMGLQFYNCTGYDLTFVLHGHGYLQRDN